MSHTIKRAFKCTCSLLLKFINFIARIVLKFVNFIVQIVFPLLTLAFVITLFWLLYEKYSNSSYITEFLSGLIWFGNQLDNSSSSSDISSDLIAFTSGSVSLILTVYAFCQYKKAQSDIKKASPIQTKEIKKDGVDDLKIMLPFYQKAKKVTVFAGDFSWITTNTEMLEAISALINKQAINFVSYKTEDIVSAAINDDSLFKKVKPFMTFSNPQHLKCSLVEHGSEQAFLYKVANAFGEVDSNPYVCILFPKDNAKQLCHTLNNLCVQANGRSQ
ncbi:MULTISPECIES: hypothetical protein [unclassified Pseudoalteromonas]|uniref:hypothetical protein n=1 Tax=unclassified Pseudoalteromonas TaxID=194690 RepID=UPI00041D6468|nr:MULTISPECIES: hypothetical protein [unclassified Pseudoalteromonas]MDC9497277.1 hypothetical protein [Pseudoalteromonas sp. Angola-20]MDC9517492.1 hypothetical protein [Pseudoalteromonas sp. Angola-22]MDC9533788.1 hypothetical protein [Pseudoalteromonas sp. Angola-9]TMP81094.1 hypothetical protein CWB71_12515 [Pseudoalteromonas sp. S983]